MSVRASRYDTAAAKEIREVTEGRIPNFMDAEGGLIFESCKGDASPIHSPMFDQVTAGLSKTNGNKNVERRASKRKKLSQ